MLYYIKYKQIAFKGGRPFEILARIFGGGHHWRSHNGHQCIGKGIFSAGGHGLSLCFQNDFDNPGRLVSYGGLYLVAGAGGADDRGTAGHHRADDRAEMEFLPVAGLDHGGPQPAVVFAYRRVGTE